MSKEPEKVCCRDCKWYQAVFNPPLGISYPGFLISDCAHPSNLETVYSPLEKKVKRIMSNTKKNEHNNCKDYKRKWWLLWKR